MSVSTNLVTGGADQKTSAIFKECAVESTKAVSLQRLQTELNYVVGVRKRYKTKVIEDFVRFVSIYSQESRSRGTVRLAGALGAAGLACNSMMKQRMGGTVAFRCFKFS